MLFRPSTSREYSFGPEEVMEKPGRIYEDLGSALKTPEESTQDPSAKARR
jgi:hypothetical protein